MKPVGTVIVQPSLPPELEPMRALAMNLRWSWHPATRELFRRLDADLWEETGHNPVDMLGRVSQQRLAAAVGDEGFRTHLRGVEQRLQKYLGPDSTWYQKAHGATNGPVAAYFSAEFGLTECLPIFAGGLGVLAGDHLKSASDLGVPLVGVGLLYQQGYFRQYLNAAGWQGENYPENDFHRLPVQPLLDAAGQQVRIGLQLPGRRLAIQLWYAAVGRVKLVLLDTNIDVNAPVDHNITDQLYGGDSELRLQQELVLGIGGLRALHAAGYDPQVLHMNEGHSAFLGLERVRDLRVAHGLSFPEALELARAGITITTHTPVEAGHDRFPAGMMRHYFSDYASELGVPIDGLLALGCEAGSGPDAPFNMSMLALRLAAHANGVSELHARVTRRMWRNVWPGLPEEEIPIGSVSNGVHYRSWISLELDELFERYLGRRWRQEPADREVWQRAQQIPAEELWRTHEKRRHRMIEFIRRRVRQDMLRRRAMPAELAGAEELLDPDALTIGFARRFAPYKRATLLLHDPARLAALVQHADRRVQFIFAGKAHPHDHAGKELIRQIIELSRAEPFRGRVVFVEDYDTAVARYLVQGCDVWLNTPRRPYEASGTSGMKAAANGVLNVSTIDGWWADAWNRLGQETLTPGWSIGSGEEYGDPAEQDKVEAAALYDLLENVVVPEFYERRTGGLPRRWVQRMQFALAELCPEFNTHRMVREYTESCYLPALAHTRRLAADGCAGARALAQWRARITQAWHETGIERVESSAAGLLNTGEPLTVTAEVRLAPRTPEDVQGQLGGGRIDAAGELPGCTRARMVPDGAGGDGRYRYQGTVPVVESGQIGYTVRIMPRHPELVPSVLPGLITWAG
ncbi:MAG: glycosyltransferase family 1 protein [Gemmatimonadetes bacterium]|nr:glycosyltransferase family 1 protein [Gemmatimonadota bacterium]